MKRLRRRTLARPVQGLRRRHYTAIGVLLGLVTMLWVAGSAFADAGNPVLGTITPTVTDNGSTVTISVNGQWTWLSHKSDCNFNRAATGAGIIWSDPTEDGFNVNNSGIFVGTAGKHAVGAAWPGGPGFDPNPIDQMVHPVDIGNKAVTPNLPGPAGQAFNDPSSNDPNDFASWKGGCGRSPFTAPGTAIAVTAASESPDGTGNLTLASPLVGVAVGDPTLQIAGMFNAGYNSPTGDNAVTVTAVSGGGTQIAYQLNPNSAGTLPSCSSAATCKGKANLEPWGSWGYQTDLNTHAFSHTYTKLMANGQSGLPSRVCVNFYDVHGGGTVASGNFQDVNGAKEITVDANGDNSIQTNDFDVTQGANCINLTQPGIVTHATDAAAGSPITDTATLSGLPAGAGGTLTFQAYGPRSLASTTPDCSGAVQYSSSLSVNSNGDYLSSDGSGGVFAPSAAGKYDWTVHYEPPAGSTILTVDSPCGTPTTGDHKEVSTVSKVSPTVVTNAGGPFTLGASGSDLTDSATLAGGTTGISGTITFSLFSDASCSVQVGNDVTKTVSGNGVYVSPPVHVNAAGTYHWIANYGGDANNNPTANGCNEANENVLVISPGISITKKPDSQTIRNGGTASWTITVTNTGDAALTAVHVTDAQAPGCSRTAVQIAADRGSSTFAPNASYSYTCSLAGVTASFTNTAVATGTPPVGDDVSAQDSADVLVINPHITVLKTPHEQTIRTGDSVSWTIQVINDGDSTLTDVKVTDAQAPGCARTSADISGLASMPAAPAAGSTVTYQCSRANNTDSFTNVADAIGTPPAGPAVSSEDSAHVTVIHPHISVSKTPHSQTVAYNGTVTFTIGVTNDGDATLTNVRVTDAQAPGCGRTSADLPQLASLAPGDHLSYACTVANVIADFTNVVVATGTPPLGADVTSTDSAAVTVGPPPPPVAHPAISIVKNPKSQTVTSGGTATFTITVTNTGDVALTNVTVSDPRSPNCDRTIGTLAPGASVSYKCTRANVTASFDNVAVVTGTAGSTTVTARDTAPVTAKKAFVPKKVVPKVVSHRKPKATG